MRTLFSLAELQIREGFAGLLVGAGVVELSCDMVITSGTGVHRAGQPLRPVGLFCPRYHAEIGCQVVYAVVTTIFLMKGGIRTQKLHKSLLNAALAQW